MFSLFKAPRSTLHTPNLRGGFTLIEMTVVITIFLITTVIVLSNFGDFRKKSSLDLLAREIALTIRQAQVYGAATRVYSSTDSEFPSYGIQVMSDRYDFILFADKGELADGSYSGPDELVERFDLYGGAFISAVRGYWGDGLSEPITKGCSDEGDAIVLNITFPRPATEAWFLNGSAAGERSGCYIGTDQWSDYAYVKITVSDQTGDYRDILIWRTGHIYVESELG